MNHHACVVGAGIGGLMTALTLAEHGHDVTVLERADALRPVGAGIGVAPNAVALMERYGLADALRQRGRVLDSMTLCTDAGRVLSAAALRYPICGGLYQPVGIHRADLVDLLRERAEATGRVVVRLGEALTGLDWTPERVEVHTARGAQLHAQLLIGADGIHSRVRAALHGDTAPRYAGYTCWRGVSELDTAAPSDAAGHVRAGDPVADRGALEAWGPGRRFGIVPIGQGRTYWFAVANAPPGTTMEGDAAKAFLREHFGQTFSLPQVLALIEATPAAAILHNDIVDRPPLRSWGDGRVTLLGDAAHAMTPNLGQGACQAIEDACMLAQALSTHGPLPAALRSYEAARIPRTAAMVRRSARLGKMAQWQQGWFVALRNWALRMAPSERMHAGMARDLEAGVAAVLGAGPKRLMFT